MIRSPAITTSQVRATATAATTARHRLVETVRGGAHENNGIYYWGQFLVGPSISSQLGVYGTAAGAEILARNGETANVTNLCAAVANPTSNVPGFKADDVQLVHKVAAIVSAAAAIDPNIDLTNPAVVRLVALQLPSGGWAGYDASVSPNPVPGRVETAGALLALAKVPDWQANPTGWLNAVGWLVAHLASGSEIEGSIGLLAVRAYQPRVPAAEWERWEPAVKAAQARAAAVLRDREPDGRAVHHYVAKLSGVDQNKYMLYVQEVVAAVALLAAPSSEPVTAGTAVTRTVEDVADRIQASGSLDLDGRHATVDQLWADRLLEVYATRAGQSPRQFLPQVIRFFRSTKGWVRALVGLVTLVITAIGGVVGASDGPGIVRGAAFVVSGLGLTALWSVLARRDP